MSYAGDCGGVPTLGKLPSQRDVEGAVNVYGNPKQQTALPAIKEETVTLTTARQGEETRRVSFASTGGDGAVLSALRVRVPSYVTDRTTDERLDYGNRASRKVRRSSKSRLLKMKPLHLQHLEVSCNIAEIGAVNFCQLFHQRAKPTYTSRPGADGKGSNSLSSACRVVRETRRLLRMWTRGEELRNLYRVLGPSGVSSIVDKICACHGTTNNECNCGIVRIDVTTENRVKRQTFEMKNERSEKQLYFPQCRTTFDPPALTTEDTNTLRHSGTDPELSVLSSVSVTIQGWPEWTVEALVHYTSIHSKNHSPSETSPAVSVASSTNGNVDGAGDNGGNVKDDHGAQWESRSTSGANTASYSTEMPVLNLSGLGLDDSAPASLVSGQRRILAQFNQFTRIPVGLLHEQLHDLNLCHNNIDTIPPHILRSVLLSTKLRKLSLCHNMLRSFGDSHNVDWTNLDRNFAAAIARVESLDLSFNSMQSIPAVLLSLTNLKTLNLAGNNIVEFPTTLKSMHLCHRVSLLSLWLWHSMLSYALFVCTHTILADARFLSTLVELHIAFNAIRSIPNTTGMPRLETLDIAANSLAHIPAEFSRLFPLLEKLDVSRSLNLSNSSQTFHCPLSLRSLVWTQSNLTGVSLHGCQSLTFLDLGGNQLRDVVRDPPLSNMVTLLLNRNGFRDLSILDKTQSNSDILDKTQSIGGVDEFKRLRRLNLSRNNLVGRVVVKANLKSVETVDLSHNEMAYLELRQTAPQLKRLDVSHNLLVTLDGIFQQSSNVDEKATDGEVSASTISVTVLKAHHNRLTRVSPWVWEHVHGAPLVTTPSGVTSLQNATTATSTTISSGREVDLSYNQITTGSLNLRRCLTKPISGDETDDASYQSRKANTFVSINLSHNNLDSLPQDILCVGVIGSLDLSSNMIGSLHNTASRPARGVDIEVSRLDLSMNRLGPTLWWPLIGWIKNLQHLDVSHNGIRKFLLAKSIPWLISLDVSNNELTSLDISSALQASPRLLRLDAAWNRINRIAKSRSFLSDQKKGEIDDLRKSSEFGSTRRERPPEHRSIDLQGNNITSHVLQEFTHGITRDGAAQTQQIRETLPILRSKLNVCWNPIDVLPHWDCRESSSWLYLLAAGVTGMVEHVRLSDQHLETIDLDAFPPGAKSVDISKNRLKHLDDPVSDVALSWEEVDVSHNGITIFPEFFINLPSLRVLILSKNRFVTIPEAIFRHKSLQVLDISANFVVALPQLTADSRIRELLMSDMGVKIPPRFFSFFPRLEFLDVSKTFHSWSELVQTVTMDGGQQDEGGHHAFNNTSDAFHNTSGSGPTPSEMLTVLGEGVVDPQYRQSANSSNAGPQSINRHIQWVVYPSRGQRFDSRILQMTGVLVPEWSSTHLPRPYKPLDPQKQRQLVSVSDRRYSLAKPIATRLLYGGDNSNGRPLAAVRTFWVQTGGSNNRAHLIYLPRAGKGKTHVSQDFGAVNGSNDVSYVPVAVMFVTCIPVQVSQSGQVTLVNVTTVTQPHSWSPNKGHSQCVRKTVTRTECPWHADMAVSNNATDEYWRFRRYFWSGGALSDLPHPLPLTGVERSQKLTSFHHEVTFEEKLQCDTSSPFGSGFDALGELSHILHASESWGIGNAFFHTVFREGQKAITILNQMWLSQASLVEFSSDMNLVDLERLHIESCAIDSLPANFLLRMPSLKQLKLRHLPIVKVPDEIANMHSLTSVTVSRCKLSDAEVLFRIPNLQYLDISGNLLESLPSEVSHGGVKELHTLIAVRNHFKSLPLWVTTHSTLRQVDVASNKLEHVGHWNSSALTRLDLYGNRLTSLPIDMGSRLPNLEILQLGLNKLRSIPASLVSHPTITLLEVIWNFLEDLPAVERGATTKHLYLDNNHLHSLPKAVSDSTTIETLRLNGNPIMEPLPANFLQMPSLKSLAMVNCNMTDTVMANLNAPLADSMLRTGIFEGNSLTVIPPAILKGPFSTLSFFRNEISTLPREIVEMSQLSEFFALHNPLNSTEQSYVNVFEWMAETNVKTDLLRNPLKSLRSD